MTKFKNIRITVTFALIVAMTSMNLETYSNTDPFSGEDTPYSDVFKRPTNLFTSLFKSSKNIDIEIQCPDDISTYTDIDQCTADVGGLNLIFEGTPVRLTWEMSGATVEQSPQSGINQLDNFTFNEGTTVVTYQLTDNQGDEYSCTFSVTVSDNQLPRFIDFPTDIAVDAEPDECGAHVYWNEPIAEDNCATGNQILISSSHTPGMVFPIGLTTVTYTANDGIETNQVNYSFTVRVTDRLAPEITVPENIVLDCGDAIPQPYASYNEFISAGGFAYDNCEMDYNSFKLESENQSGSDCAYTITRVYSIADSYGNRNSVTQSIIIGEGEEPVATEEPAMPLKSGMAGTITAQANGDWNNPATWDLGRVPLPDDDVVIPNTFTVAIDAAANCQNILIESGGVLNHSSTTTLLVSGNWTNNGTFDSGTGTVEFTGSTAASISGTSSTIFDDFVLNKGSISNVLQVNSDIELGGDITFTSGLLQVNSGTDITCTHNAGFRIENSAGLYINGGTFTTGSFSMENNGLLQIDNGTLNIGASSGNGMLIMSSGVFEINGGTINVAGRLEVSGGTLDMSDGTVNLNTIGHNSSTTATLDITTTSNISLTGGTINFDNPNGSGYYDVYIEDGGSKSFNGSTLNFGDGSIDTYKILTEVDLTTATISAASNAELEITRRIDSDGSYTFDLSDGNGDIIPVTINISATSYGPDASIEVTSTDVTHTNNASSTHFLSRYWTVTINDITNPNYSITAEYSEADISGTENQIAAGAWDGSLPWSKFNTINTASNTISANGLTNSIEFTGITLAPPTISIDEGATTTICSGDDIIIHTTANGDPTLIYSWISTPAGSYPNNADITVSPTVNTTYTVTVTDGNGFTAQDQITVNVDPVSVGGTLASDATVCSGTNSTTLTLSGQTGDVQRWESSTNGGSSWSTTSNTNTSYTATNLTQTTQYRAIVQSGVCSEATSTVATITVNPIPTVDDLADLVLCDGDASGSISFNGTGTSYNWTNNNTSIGLGASGTDNISSFTATNSGSSTVTATITVTPVYSNNGIDCYGSQKTFTITVNPSHTISLSSAAATDNQELCLPDAIEDITYAIGGGATGATVSGLSSSGLSGTYSGGTFTISGTPTIAGPFNYTVTTTGNSCTPVTATGTIIVHPTPTVKITISPNSTICEGTPVTFTTTVEDAGTTPTFIWQTSNDGTNWNNIPGEVSDSYSSSSLANGQRIRVIMTADPSHCSAVITSNSYVMTVNPTVVPSVTVNYSSDDICDGETVTFEAIITNPGTSPTYQWQIFNGTSWDDIPGENGNFYTTSTLADGDQIRAYITSNANCASPTNAFSSPVLINVNPILDPEVSISANPSTAICPGETIQFTAIPTNGGSNPTYQWKVNGIAVGTNLSTYSTASLTDGDEVTVEMTSSIDCPSDNPAISNIFTAAVNPGTPAIPGTVTGSAWACPGETGLIYSVVAVAGVEDYSWTVPGDWSYTGDGNNNDTIYVDAGTVNGNITVAAQNSCGTSSIRNKAVSVLIESTVATSINVSNNNTCEGTSKTLTVVGGSLGTGAQWHWYTGSCGGTEIGTGTSVTVNPAPGTYTYYVRAEGTCNTTDCVEVDVIVSPGAPAQPDVITGTTPVCPGESQTYTIAAVTDADSYSWSVPAGWTITSGQGTTSITVTSGAYGQNGNIGVTASNSCGTSPAKTLAVTVDPGTPADPGNITGTELLCAGSSEVYSIDAIQYATNYVWTVPAGWTITNGNSTNSITVTAGTTDGYITVYAENSCGTSGISQLYVEAENNSVLTTPDTIIGNTANCPTLSAVYRTHPVADADGYYWTVPGGWIIDGQSDTSLYVTIPGGAAEGYVTVAAYNVCDTSEAYSLYVNVDNTATVYAGPDQEVCEGTIQVYLAGEIGGAINSKQDWNWESINYPEDFTGNPKKIYFDDPDALTTLFDFPAGVAPGDTIYIRIYSTTSVGGCGAISDTMMITIKADPIASIETDTVCEGESATLTITATPFTRVTYIIDLEDQRTVDIGESGTATIVTDPLTENTTYNIMRIRYLNGTSCEQSINGVANIVVKKLPVVDAGTDQSVCASESSVTLAGSVTGDVTTGIWSGGAGSFVPNEYELDAVYIPTPSEIASGSLTLTLTSDDPDGPCEPVSDYVTILFNQSATVNAGADLEMCADGSVSLAGSFGGAATGVTWSGGVGIFAPNATTLTATYTPTATEIANGSVELILTTNDPAGVCNPVSDTVVVTIYPEAIAEAGSDQTICEGSTVTLSGSVSGGASSGTWSGGSGIFDDVNNLVTNYTPTADEISDGFVILTLTTNDPDGPCAPGIDQVRIDIEEAPTVNAGIDDRVCEGSTIILNGSFGGSATSATWSTVSGLGSFSNPNTMNAVYTHPVGRVGKDTLILTTDDPLGLCVAVSDTMILTIDTTIGVTVGNDTMICSDATIVLDGWVESGIGTWSTSGSGSFSNVNDRNAIYTPSNGDIFNGSVILTFTTEDPDGDCGPASDYMELTIKEVITITTQPVNTGACATDTAELFVQAVGDDLIYQWYYLDGTPVSASATINGVTSPTLQFTNATSANMNSYYVEITSPTACDIEVSDTVTLNVDEEISVTTPVESDSICVGGSVTFNIVAEPGGQLAYQWRKDGVDLSDGANISGVNTNTLIITNLTAADEGNYTVYMEGLSGYTCADATSAPAYLSVIEYATITPSDQSATFCLNAPIDTIIYTLGGGILDVTITSGTLPAGLLDSFDVVTNRYLIFGTPTTPGTSNIEITADGFCNDETATGTIVINAELVAPEISNDQSICYNSVPGALTTLTLPAGGAGTYDYQWQDSISGGSWTDISGAAVDTYAPPALTDTTYYRLIATDTGDPSCGSAISNVITISPFDNEPPTFTVPVDATRNADANCFANTDPSRTGVILVYDDNCTDDATLALNTVWFDHDTIDNGCGITFQRTWQVSDEAGNIALDTQLITIVDATAPIIQTRATNQIIDCGVDRHPDILGWSTFTDNCDDDVEVDYYDVVVPGSCEGDSTVYRYWIGIDDCGNRDTASTPTIITIEDITAPIVIDKKNMLIDCVDDLPQASEIPDFVIDENCGSYTVELIDEYAFGIDDVSGYCPYKVDRTWKVTDDCGKYTTFVQSIVISQLEDCPVCEECLYDNTYNWADLTGNADSTITFYDVVKRDKCCGAENQPGGDNLYCASFNIKIDPMAVGVEILVDHVTPPGQDWKVDCEDVDGGSVVCLEPGRFHLFTFCKHAESDQPQENDYTFRSISGLLEGGDIETREECDKILEVDGTFESVTWTSIYPGNPGDYDHLLSGDSDTLKYFNAEIGSPPHIQYQVCGQLSQSLCFTDVDGWLCDTLDVFVHEAISIDLNVNPDLICVDYIPTITPTVYPAGTYELQWFNSAYPSGTPDHIGPSFTPDETGSYSLVAVDIGLSGLGCNTDTFLFDMAYDLTGPTIKDTPPPLYLNCNDPNYANIIDAWLAIPTAEYVNEFGDIVATPVNNDYYDGPGVTMICGDSVPVVFTAMDQCSNDTTELSYIIVIDTTAPVITPAIDTVVDCNTLDKNTHPDYIDWLARHGGATATDQCDPNLVWSADTSTAVWVGDGARDSITVTFYVEDDCGNIEQTTATFTIIDDQPPTITCPPNVTEYATDDLCAKVLDTLEDPVIGDICSTPVLTWVSTGAIDSSGNGTVADVAFPVGFTTVTYIVTDAANLTAECTFTVTIVDTIPPSLAIEGCEHVEGYMDADDCVALPPAMIDPTYTDDCWPVDSLVLSFEITGAWDTTGLGYVSGFMFPVGVSTVIYTVTDPDGYSDACSFTVTMLRDAIPSTAINCPPVSKIVSIGSSSCDTTLTLPAPTITEVCTTATYTITNNINGGATIVNETFETGITRVVWYIEDNSGNIDSCEVYVEVNGVQLPTITCPAPVSGTMSADGCYAIPPTIGSPVLGSPCWDVDSLDLTFRITNGAWDTTGVGEVNGLQFPAGVNTVWYIVTDPDGNKDSCDFTVSILRDAIPSTAINCPTDPAPVTLGATECEALITLDPPTITDFCVTATYTITNNINSGSTIIDETFETGTTRVVWYIEDNSGNIDSCEVYVEVNGVQLPTITCPAPVSGTMSADGCYAIPPTIGSPVLGSPCWDVDSLDLTFRITNGAWDTTGVGEVNGLQFPAGVNTVWYIVTDPDGNKDSCDFTVSILRDAIPSTAINCPPSPPAVTLGATECEALITLDPPTITDFCVTATYTITNNINSGSTIIDEIFETGTTRVVWYIEDNSGNIDSCIVFVEINGVQLPTITCPAPVSGTMTADDCYAIPPNIGSPVLGSPCWDVDSLDLTFRITNGAWDTTGVGEVNGLYFPAGVNTVWYIVTDPDGNKDSCDFTVSMLRDAIPSTAINCPTDPAPVTVAIDACEAFVDLDPPTITEECITSTYTIYNDYTGTANGDTLYPIGITEVKWYIEDNSGNIDSCIVSVEVIDLPPTLTVPADIVKNADFNEAYASGIVVPHPIYQDNCDSTLTWRMWGVTAYTVGDTLAEDIYVVHSPDTFNLGVTYVEYTFTDGHGNTLIDTFTITVLGAPDIVCPPDTTVYLDGTENNCEATFDPGVPDLIEGVPPITWTYTIEFADGSTTGPVTYTKNAPDQYADPLGDLDFPLGVTTIYWRAQNEAGFDTCSHWIEVIDTIPPTLDADPYENCVDQLHWAEYDPANATPTWDHIDPLVEKNPVDYRTMFAGDTILDLTSLEDNCCDSLDMTVYWRIEFSDTPDPHTGAPQSHPDITGTGQPSEYLEGGVPADIYLWGDGVFFSTVTHQIYYWAEDCNGNTSEEIRREIVITPRPEVKKQNY